MKPEGFGSFGTFFRLSMYLVLINTKIGFEGIRVKRKMTLFINRFLT